MTRHLFKRMIVDEQRATVANDQEDLTEFDDILIQLGQFGKYQLRVIGLVQFVGFFGAWQILVSNFYL